MAGKTVEIAEMLLVALTESTEFAAKFAMGEFAALVGAVWPAELESAVVTRQVLSVQVELAK